MKNSLKEENGKFENYQFQESISKNEHIESKFQRRKYLPETWSE